jgi:hypothetical protein
MWPIPIRSTSDCSARLHYRWPPHRLDPDILSIIVPPAGRFGEALRGPGSDLHACFALHHLDAPHLLPRDMAAPAEEGQDPARIGVAVASNIEAEPEAFIITIPILMRHRRALDLLRFRYGNRVGVVADAAAAGCSSM